MKEDSSDRQLISCQLSFKVDEVCVDLCSNMTCHQCNEFIDLRLVSVLMFQSHLTFLVYSLVTLEGKEKNGASQSLKALETLYCKGLKR